MSEEKPRGRSATTVSISLPPSEAQQLRERAKREDRSVSSVVRIALRRAAELERAELAERA